MRGTDENRNRASRNRLGDPRDFCNQITDPTRRVPSISSRLVFGISSTSTLRPILISSSTRPAKMSQDDWKGASRILLPTQPTQGAWRGGGGGSGGGSGGYRGRGGHSQRGGNRGRGTGYLTPRSTSSRSSYSDSSHGSGYNNGYTKHVKTHTVLSNKSGGDWGRACTTSLPNWGEGDRRDYAKLNSSVGGSMKTMSRELERAWGRGGSQGTRRVYVFSPAI